MLKKIRKMNRKWRTYGKFHYRRKKLWLKLNEAFLKAQKAGDVEKAEAILLCKKRATREVRMSC